MFLIVYTIFIVKVNLYGTHGGKKKKKYTALTIFAGLIIPGVIIPIIL